VLQCICRHNQSSYVVVGIGACVCFDTYGVPCSCVCIVIVQPFVFQTVVRHQNMFYEFVVQLRYSDVLKADDYCMAGKVNLMCSQSTL